MYGLTYCFIFIILILITETKGQISWTLYEKPAIFGKTVKLICKLPTAVSCCKEFTRKWSKGWDNERIVMNSVSLNESKYEEHLNVSTKSSLLTIKKFSNRDINIPYQCTYGFDTARKILILTATDFEYHPNEKLPVRLLVNDKQTATINITFSMVYPVPNCFAFDNDLNITSHISLEVDNNGIFYKTNLTFEHRITDGSHIIFIRCSVGSTSFIVVNSTLSCSKAILSKWTLEVIGGSIGALTVCLLVLVVVLRQTQWQKYVGSKFCPSRALSSDANNIIELKQMMPRT